MYGKAGARWWRSWERSRCYCKTLHDRRNIEASEGTIPPSDRAEVVDALYRFSEAQHLPHDDHRRHLLLKNIYTCGLSKQDERWLIDRMQIRHSERRCSRGRWECSMLTDGVPGRDENMSHAERVSGLGFGER